MRKTPDELAPVVTDAASYDKVPAGQQFRSGKPFAWHHAALHVCGVASTSVFAC